MNWKVIGLLSVLNILFLVIGGVIFKELESTEEVNIRTHLLNSSIEFLDRHPCVPREDLVLLVQDFLNAYDAGVIGGNLNASTESTNWDLASSIFFATTVVTTIGYGNLSPATSGGKAFCVFYAVVGIPLMLMLLVGFGQKLHKYAMRLENFRICSGGPKIAKYLKVVTITLAGYATFVLVPSVVFAHVEGWTYSEAVYFSMITLTTIGFGDFVAGTEEHYEHRTLYRICLGLWTIIGLAWVSLLLDTFQDFVQSKVDEPGSVEAISDECQCKSRQKEDNEEVADKDRISLGNIDDNKNTMSKSRSEICDGTP